MRSPREPTRPRRAERRRARRDRRGLPRLGGQRRSRPGFQVIELHAAHGYLLAQFLSAATNRGAATGARRSLERVDRARSARLAPTALLGIRLSIDGERGRRADARRARRAAAARRPARRLREPHRRRAHDLRARHGDRRAAAARRARAAPAAGRRGRCWSRRPSATPDAIEAALAAGADLVGMARALIADPDLPRKLLERPRGGDPAVRRLQRGLPRVRPAAAVHRQPGPGAAGRAAPARRAARRARRREPRRRAAWRSSAPGPAGLECALSARAAGRGRRAVRRRRARSAAQLAIAAAAPNRTGWRAAAGLLRARGARAASSCASARRSARTTSTASTRSCSRSARRGRCRTCPASSARCRRRDAIARGA